MIEFASITPGPGDRSIRVGAEGIGAVPTTLGQLASTARSARIEGAPETPVLDVAYDSRDVRPGALFFCVPGARADGHDFAAAAVEAGATALVVERALDLDVPQVVVGSVREAMAPMSAAFFGDPSSSLALVGVTGTNGKTTSTYMLESVIRACGLRSGLIGNIQRRIGDEVLPSGRNTPEAPDLHRLLARMRDAGVEACAMEVTSEGIDQRRVDATSFACAVFTNLTQDHLNYHGTMENYFEAKAKLFDPSMSARAVVNVADPWGAKLVERVTQPLTTFALSGDADVRAVSVVYERPSTRVVADVRGRSIDLHVPLAGPYNVENALGVLAAAHALGWDLENAATGIASLRGVPGRLESIDEGQPFTVLVDYAHTPDSLDNVLRAARAIVPDGARLIAVFGCGGDRDRAKRPLMGAVAVRLADDVFITSDNPRSEDPESIIGEIEAGARTEQGAFTSIVDRRDAIAAAIRGARAGDVVVIAGKGHETGQEFADRTIPFDDRLVARDVLREVLAG